MKAIGIILSIIVFQISINNPVFIFDFDREYDTTEDSESYKYITKDNLRKIKIEEVKKLRFKKTKCRKIPDEIRTFKYVEELDLSTEMRGMYVRWMSGLCEFVGYHEKGKLQKLPNWIIEFENLKKIHLDGQTKLDIGESIRLLSQIKSLEEMTIEVNANEISDLEKIEETENMKLVKVQKEDLKDSEKKRIEKIFAGKEIKYEIESVDRKRFKK